MTVPVLTFFSNGLDARKSWLVYHLAWMLSETGERVLACDLDPQVALTASFLEDDQLESLWIDNSAGRTVHQCLAPLNELEEIGDPAVQGITDSLWLVPGDNALSSFEEALAVEWPLALGRHDLHRPFRILTAFWQIMQAGARAVSATIILVDIGPGLGAINRSALIASDHVIASIGFDLFSVHGLPCLGSAIGKWRDGWSKRRNNWKSPAFPLPSGGMNPIGYVVQQHGERTRPPWEAISKWGGSISESYARHLLNQRHGPFASKPESDDHCLSTVKPYRSLASMAQEARKPIFKMTPGDGALGSHAAAAVSAYNDFKVLADTIRERIGLARPDVGAKDSRRRLAARNADQDETTRGTAGA